MAPVAIKYPKDLNLRPIGDLGCLCHWLNNIQYDSDSVFIGFADGAYISISSETFHDAEGFI